MARRNGVNDFIRDVAAQTGVVPGHVWTATLNADNTTYSINLNGVAVYKKVIYGSSAPSGVLTDANPAGDRITILSNDDGLSAYADVQTFINNLK